jgi:hypothetical protein
MGISSILDISSFFIGMIINLIFVALMCYYFKRKYDYLEMAQTEQAKILYQMIHKNADCSAESSKDPSKEYVKDYSKDPLVHMELDSDSDSDDDSVESNEEDVRETIVITDLAESSEVEEAEPRMESYEIASGVESTPEAVSEIKEVTLDSFEITVQLTEPENAYSKMSMKQLKEILSSKGIRAKNNIKKDELIELISKEA